VIVGIECPKYGRRSFKECLLCPSEIREKLCGLTEDDIIVLVEHTALRPYIHVSDLLGCPRKVWFESREPVWISPKRAHTLLRGIRFHMAGREYVDAHELRVSVFIDGVRVVGTIDQVIGDSLLEVKTTTKALPRTGAEEAHERQAQAYWTLIKRPHYEWKDGQWIKVEGKDLTPKVKYINLRKGDAVIHEVEKRDLLPYLRERLRKLKRALFASDVPEGEPSRECRLCFYLDMCKKLDEQQEVRSKT